jgi:hypothetical protein
LSEKGNTFFCAFREIEQHIYKAKAGF